MHLQPPARGPTVSLLSILGSAMANKIHVVTCAISIRHLAMKATSTTVMDSTTRAMISITRSGTEFLGKLRR